jgi:hypothetical protein
MAPPPALRAGLRLHRDLASVRRLILALRAHPPEGQAARAAWANALRDAEKLHAALSAMARAQDRAA